MSLIVAGFLSLSLLVSLSCCMSLVSYAFWLSLTVSPSAIELLHVSHFLPWLFSVSHCLSGLMELLYVSHCLL